MPTPLFLAGEALPAAKLQQLGDDDNYTPSIEATTTDPDLGTDPVQDALIWQNGNSIEMWFRIQFGTSPSAGSGTYEILLPTAYPLASAMFDCAIGEVRLVDDSGSAEKVAILVADVANNKAVMRVCDDSSLVTNANPWTPAANDEILGHASWLTGDVTGGGGGGGGGGGTPPPATHQVDFRSLTDPASQTPVVTPTLADIEHPSGGTIYAGGTGTTHTITSLSEWNTAVAAAAPGDILKITASITSELTYRGNKYGISGGTAASGTAGNPIVIACEGAGIIDVASITGNTTCLEVFNVDHIWCVEVKTDGGQFGIYYRNCEGTSANPIRIARCTIKNTGHAALTIAGWFQLITSSGGTPPAGTGNEWGFSRHILVEGNHIEAPGRGSTQFGECIYLGNGSPSWISYARDITIRYNTLIESTADFLDIKPGCSRIFVLDNVMKEGAFHLGAAIQCLYVTSGLTARPSWYDFDPEIFIEGNRIFDGDLTNTVASSSNYCVQTSLAGVRFANNLVWGFRSGGIGFRLRSERAASESQSSDGEQWVIVNNLFWMSDGLSNVGAPAASPSPFSAGLIDARNNIGLTGTTGGVEATATASDFIDSAAIPTIHTVDADAEWETYGQGSAFDLDPASGLVDSGSDIADVTLHIAEDISQRVIPSPSPNPGPFQEHPANA